MNRGHKSDIKAEIASFETLQQVQQASPAVVLRELFELLEDYSPVWYSEEVHNRAISVLRRVSQPGTIS